MADMSNMIPITEYATRNGKNPIVVRQKCQRGTLPGAIKMGRDWFVPADAPYPDNRVKSRKYKDWRRKGRTSDSDLSGSDSPGSE